MERVWRMPRRLSDEGEESCCPERARTVGKEPQQLLGQHLVENDVAQPPPAQDQCLGLRERRKTQRHQQLQGRDLGLIFFGWCQSS